MFSPPGRGRVLQSPVRFCVAPTIPLVCQLEILVTPVVTRIASWH